MSFEHKESLLHAGIVSPARSAGRNRLGLVYKSAIAIYVFSIVLLSYQDGLTRYAKIAGVLLAALFIFRGFAGGGRLSIPREYKLLLAWFIFGVISSILSKEPEVALYRVLTLVQIFPLAFIVSIFILWNGDSTFYWRIVIGAAAVCGGLALVNSVTFSQIDGRMFGTLEHPNNFAALMAISTSICLAALVSSRPIMSKVLWLIAAAFFLYLVGRSGSRTGTIASIVGIFTLCACLLYSRRRRGVGAYLTLLVVGGSLTLVAITYLTSTMFSDRFVALLSAAQSGVVSNSVEESLAGRAWMFMKGIEIFLENPVLGSGLDMFRTVDFGTGRAVGNNSHSNYIEVLANTGIVGGLLYYAMYYCWWSRLIKSRSILRDPHNAVPIVTAICVAALVLVFDLGFVSYYEKLNWLILAGLIADSNLIGGRSTHGVF